MKTRTRLLIVPAIAVAGAAALLALSGSGDAATASPRRLADDPALVERGRYLVNNAVLCIDCHSPHNERGEQIAGQHLTGAPIPFAPTVPMPFALAAPPLAGMPAGYTEEEFVHFLMTGERPRGTPLTLPPMPPYRLAREDAESVVAYIHSLPAHPGK